jgi:replicative DNA helicase
MRYQQGTYGLSQDLRFCRQQSMEISRELSAVKKELEETKLALASLRASLDESVDCNDHS